MVIHGPVPRVEVGRRFANRSELHNANVHRGLMRGIAPEGSSIVLSGGYVDDEDFGNTVIYTGEGGRDPNTGSQIADQSMTGGNLALAQKSVSGESVRVTRGHKLDSTFAPESGYTYDGLFRIESYWQERGRDGFLIYRYRLERSEGQLARSPASEIPEQEKTPPSVPPHGDPNPGRASVTTTRIIRSTEIGNEVKRLHNHTCQMCGLRLETPTGPYAECCHIKPLGRPHNGPDTLENVLCLCANCHVLFDKYALRISDDFSIVETGAPLHIVEGHDINMECVLYHRSLAGE